MVKCSLAVVATLIMAWDVWVSHRYRRHLFDDIDKVPPHRYALVLGTSPVLKNGAINRYYQYRMQAAALLYHKGKVEIVVVSGTDDGQGYSEPEAMRRDLQDLGVPAMQIVMDKSGLRTIDSVFFAQKQGLMDDWLVVSQAFHNQRALVMATHMKLSACAFNAQDVQSGLKVQIRERFARMRLAWDLVLYRVGKLKSPHSHTL